MTKICIIGIYFGTLPEYFPMWLKSAEYNSSVDFLIFTDQKFQNLPNNVKFVEMALQNLREIAEKKLGFDIALKRPYKCCDLKPAYGILFEEFISEYDYWGHCDFDLIWGDLCLFFARYNLDEYDKFLSLGHLSLYRNTYVNNRRFMNDGSNVGSYDKVFCDERNFAFDELSGVYQIYKKHGFKMFDKRIFADISKIYKRFRLAKKDKNYECQVFCWENGHVYRYYVDMGEEKKDEFIYIHFKERKEMKVAHGCEEASRFVISADGFIPLNEKEKNINDMIRFNLYKGFLNEKKELYIYKKNLLLTLINRKIFKKEKIR